MTRTCVYLLWLTHSEKPARTTVHRVSKNIPDIIDCNLKKDYQIFINFTKNIPDTACHQTIVKFPTSPNVCFCTTWEKQHKRNMH